MAGSIPPLVSSTPPPLCAFDDDEDEEEEDEFGMYIASEDIEYGECISFKEKNGEKQTVGNCRGEQDSTSQDSATDSGLCPDSEGMSPTPHSDEERTVKHCATSVCDRLSTVIPTLTKNLNHTEGLDLSSNLPNGHDIADHSEDDFGNFETSECTQEGVKKSSLLLEEERGAEFNFAESFSNTEISLDLKTEEVQDNKQTNETSERLNCEDAPCDEGKNVSSDSETRKDSVTPQTFEFPSGVGVSFTPNVDHCDDLKNVEEQDISLKESPPSIASPILTIEQNAEVKPEVNESDQLDDEFDDFTDFKADFSNFNDSTTEQCDDVSEHSKPKVEQTFKEETIKVPPDNKSDDEFSDFTEFSSSDCAFVRAQNSVEHIPHIPVVSSDNSDVRTDSEFQDWVSVFPSSSDDSTVKEERSVVILRDSDPVWTRLIPMESSPALLYQWAESHANRHLLSALNIDSRNILMMPWMPRFAANLSCGPLQPVKALEPLQPTSAPVTVQLSSGPESVPEAHFDWVSSGLTNPLDSSHSSLLDLNFMMTLAPHLTINQKSVLKVHKALSAEAEAILGSLPDLSFMRKAYIDFPINKG